MKIALFNSNSFIGRCIKWQSRGKFSHAAIISNFGEIYESREFVGVRKMPTLHAALGGAHDRVELFNVDLTPQQTVSVIRFCESHLGKPYDYLSVLRFITRHKEDRASRAKWFCSEFVFDAFKSAGVELFRDTHGWEVSPDLLRRSPLVKPE